MKLLIYRIKSNFVTLLLTCCALGLLASSNAIAAGVWTGVTYVARIQVTHKDVVYVTTRTEHINPDGCTQSHWYRIAATTHEGLNKMYTTLTTNKASDQPIKLYLEGCETSYPSVKNVVSE